MEFQAAVFVLSHLLPLKCLSLGRYISFINSYVLVTNLSHLAAIFVPSHIWSLKYSLFGRHISFSSFMPTKFEIIHMCNYTAINDSHKYFTFGSHMCSFTPMTTSVFLVWQTYLFNLIYANSLHSVISMIEWTDHQSKRICYRYMAKIRSFYYMLWKRTNITTK